MSVLLSQTRFTATYVTLLVNPVLMDLVCYGARCLYLRDPDFKFTLYLPLEQGSSIGPGRVH
jgi:hypothetical protein